MGLAQVATTKHVICIIDAVCSPFSARLVRQGLVGGQAAARKLCKLLQDADHLDDGLFSVDIYVYADCASMAADAGESAHSFVAGFNQAQQYMYMLDVGDDRQKRIGRVESKQVVLSARQR
jgi:hypothetical protein